MPLILQERKKAEDYVVKADDTLEKIASEKCPELGWKVLARYNWGTAEPKEVRRAICETVGVKVADLAKVGLAGSPEKIALKPDADLAPKLKIPKAWKSDGLAVAKTHTVNVKAIQPANAVSILELDKWFIPELEKCAFEYQLEGDGKHADKVEFDVYGSKYCEASAWNKGMGTYADPAALIDVPLYTKFLGAQAEERQSYELPEAGWKGEVTTRQGLLGRKAGEAKTRYLNVAFSPYTAHVRYHKADGDKNAHLAIKGFWPSWEKNATGTLAKVADSFKVKWEVRNTGKLDRGLLSIQDGSGKLVFQKPLAKAKVGQGVNEFAWDGKYAADITNSKGGSEAIVEDMPYRVQIEAHTGENTPEGLALAAMHTEVRIYVHPETHYRKEEGFSPGAPLVPAKAGDKPGDPSSLGIALAPLHLGKNEPTDKDSLRWLQYNLALSGFHCGPVNGKDGDALKMAINEFQRSVPKRKTGATYERQSATGATSAETREALEHMEQARRRPWFGDPDASRADLTNYTDAERTTLAKELTKPERNLIVWVDWRNYYTTSDSDQSLVTIDDFRGGMEKGDQLVTDDEKIVCRPWVPLRVQVQLLSREKGLNDKVDLETDKDRLAKMRRALGPLRVDWTFAELEMDLEPIATGPHTSQRVRSKGYVKWAIEKMKKAHEHKSPKRNVDITNCPKAHGGIRPDGDALAPYYKEVFGHKDDERLEPWHVEPNDTTESVVTVVHDHLTAGQELLVDAEPPDDGSEPLDEKNIGWAGVFFRPSTIGGDGYQLRAQFRFEKLAGKYEFPNLEYLERRYLKLPQACTAKFRVWRKSSFRARIGWGAATDHFNAAGTLYAAGHTHFVHELGTPASYLPTQLVDKGNAADLDKYRTLLHGKCEPAAQLVKNDMDLSDTRSYPWHDRDDLGWKFASPPNIAQNDVKDKLLDLCEGHTWGKFQEALLLDLVRRIEEREGRMRGHVMAPFKGSGDAYAQQYKCQNCGDTFWYLQKSGVTDKFAGATCESCNTSGNQGVQPNGECDGTYGCAHPGCGWTWTGSDWYPNGGNYTGSNCPTCGNATVQLNNVAETKAKDPPARISFDLITYGIGNPAGSVWVTSGMAAWEWGHEVGHNRHLEHAADAPVDGRVAQRTALHDSQTNSLAAFKPATLALNRQWDRCCVMSYVDLQSAGLYEPAKDVTYFCGKCVLRLRGWKVEAIAGGPGPAVTTAP